MRKIKAGLLLAPVAVFSMPFLASTAASAAPAANYQATLDPMNHSTASGMLSLRLNGDQATVTEHVSGLAATFKKAPFPHVQHIHSGAKGSCPTPAADKSGDGVVNTAEGQASYGPISTTLSTKGDTSPKAGTNVKTAPGGASFDYQRTITLDSKTMSAIKSGNAVIVIHGLDPTTLSKKAQSEKSELVPSLPLAATSPAACGPLSAMPTGGAATGGGATSGVEHLWLFVAGGAALTAAGGALVLRRIGLGAH